MLITLPPQSIAMDWVETCTQIPTIQTTDATKIVTLLPKISAMKPAAKDATNMPTISEAVRICWLYAEISEPPPGRGVPNLARKVGIARTFPVVEASNPKLIGKR